MHRTPSRSDKVSARAEGVRVMNALRRVVRDLRLGAREAERAAGVSGAQLFVLQALREADASSLGDVAERTLTDQSSVSVVVRKLTERGLVAAETSREDARRVELRLTAAGRRLLGRYPEPTQARLVGALERLTSAELSGLREGLDALVREMDLGMTEPRMFFEDEPRRRKKGRRRDPG
jgi:DNA-binding MarR family transcriptional regulator